MSEPAAAKSLVWTDETVGRFWRWQSRSPETYFTYQFGDRIARGLARHLAERRKVLDYGCGVGFFVPHLLALGPEVTAADFSPESVAAAARRCQSLPKFRGAHTIPDLVRLGETFDAIVAIEVIEHLDDRHLAEFFGHLRSLLAADGIAVITTPNDERLALNEIYCPNCDHVFHRWQHVRSWSRTTLPAAVAAHGLQPVETYVTDFSWRPLAHPVNDAKRLAKRFVKRLIGRPIHDPHLVCLARKGG